MEKTKKHIIVLLIISLVFLSLYVYERQLNCRIIDKHYRIGLVTDTDLALEVNELLLKKVSLTGEEKIRIESLLTILYRNGSLYSNYEITNNRYLDQFEGFSYFEDYSYHIDQVIRDGVLDHEEKEVLEKYQEELKNIKEDLTKAPKVWANHN